MSAPSSAEATGEAIRRAIAGRRRIAFTYKGARRIVEPYIFGRDDKGVLTLSAAQVSGGSGAGFRSFDVDGIADIEGTAQRFFRNHPDYNPRDRFFAEVIAQV